MKPVRLRSLMVVVVGAVGLAASMVANASAAVTPVKTVTSQGLRVQFPGADKQTSLVGGQRYRVSVRPHGAKRGAKTSARITVTRAASGGQTAATLVRESLRKGEIRFPIVADAGVKYRIQVQIGKRRWTTRLVTVDANGGPAPGAQTKPCAPAGTITPGVTTVAAGGTLPFRITNTGNATLTYGSGNGWTQLLNGVWSNVQSPGGFGPATTSTIAPGETQTGNGAVWSSLTPGIYSMTVVATCSTTNASGTITFKAIPLQTAPITVTAAAGR